MALTPKETGLKKGRILFYYNAVQVQLKYLNNHMTYLCELEGRTWLPMQGEVQHMINRLTEEENKLRDALGVGSKEECAARLAARLERSWK